MLGITYFEICSNPPLCKIYFSNRAYYEQNYYHQPRIWQWGPEIGPLFVRSTGIAYYNQEIITEIAKRTTPDETYVLRIAEDRTMAPYPIYIGVPFQRAVNDMFMQEVAVFQEQYSLLMGVEQHQVVLRIGGDIVAELEPLIGIQAGGWFVQNQNLRVVQKGLGNTQPALHPA